jgi:hypothetical protein
MPNCSLILNQSRNDNSPSVYIIGTDWCDGILSGFLECNYCKREYWFDVVAWHYSFQERVYALMPLNDGDFNRVLSLLVTLGPPKWPVWIPIWTFSNIEYQHYVEREIDTITLAAGSPRFLVSVDSSNLCVNHCKELTNR